MELTNFILRHPTYGDLPCRVPFSMYQTLYSFGKIPDPYDGENEPLLTPLSEEDWDFICDFTVSPKELAQEYQVLRFEGIDTIADIYVNGLEVGYACNMHRIFEFDVKEALKEGENQLLIHFHSPVAYINDLQHRHFAWGHSCTMDGFSQIRKANYSFGWDWGPKLPDCGIYRPVTLLCYNTDRLSNVFLRQQHKKTKSGTDVTISCQAETLHGAGNLTMTLKVTAPDGQVFETQLNSKGKGAVTVENARLWWPHGYGDQPLYKVQVLLESGEDVLDTYTSRLGLRTLTVSNGPDTWGREFCFTVNSVKIFAMGASYVPEDNLIPRMNTERSRRLLEDCVAANFNSVRIWGGGFYCSNEFYDICDELGILLWQDFMVACCNVRLSKDFKENIMAECRDQIRRIRDHACIGIISGNNEMEEAVIGWDECKDSARDKLDYLELYEHLMPDLCDVECPDIFYWPSSPSSGGGFDDPQDENRGDAHYWGAWHGSIPFESYRRHYFRFCSEFGFEAFPSVKTIRSFAREEDMNPFGAVMENHQKCLSGNNKIISYLSDKYLYPYDFTSLVYASQLLQLDAIRYGVEHFRRFRGRCMGAIYWQLNDSWPVCSWSSIDYFGRWKALHYGAKRFFAPVLLSAHEEGTKVVFNVSNETMRVFKGTLTYRILDSDFNVYEAGSAPVNVDALTSLDITQKEFAASIKGYARDRFLAYELQDEDGSILVSSSLLFEKPRRFHLQDPRVKAVVTEQEIHQSSAVCSKNQTCKADTVTYTINVQAEKYASHVEIDFEHYDLVLSDNYFDLTDAAEKTLTAVWRGPADQAPTAEELNSGMTIRTVYNIGR
ncbi:MAG: glycoside hydrolase family 2 protein [Lachnospiraceae bacterium]|nr:glycoside hydrolase family 2 protein [Lachnospiraceae bacterium]